MTLNPAKLQHPPINPSGGTEFMPRRHAGHQVQILGSEILPLSRGIIQTVRDPLLPAGGGSRYLIPSTQEFPVG